jgi:hypothetical protein
METSVVRRRVMETIEHARRTAASRRAVADEANREYAVFLEQIAVPMFRQIAGALKASAYPFTVSTPSGSVRLTSDRTGQDFLEVFLDTSGDRPAVLLRTSRVRGSRIIETERPVGNGPVREIDEQLLLDAVARELEPYVEK